MKTTQRNQCLKVKSSFSFTLLLYLPFLLFLLFSSVFLLQDIKRENDFINAAAKDNHFGKYLYQDIRLSKLITPPQKAFHYYYQLAETEGIDEPIIIVRYPMDEADQIQVKLANLPQTFRGRTDIVVGEAHEFLQKFILRPYEDNHQGVKLNAIEYYSFNLGTGARAKSVRIWLLAGLGLLLFFLPFYYPYFFQTKKGLTFRHSSTISSLDSDKPIAASTGRLKAIPLPGTDSSPSS